jgi:hypothetical protein
MLSAQVAPTAPAPTTVIFIFENFWSSKLFETCLAGRCKCIGKFDKEEVRKFFE